MARADAAAMWDFELVLFTFARLWPLMRRLDENKLSLFAERVKIPPVVPPQFSPLITWKDPARSISD